MIGMGIDLGVGLMMGMINKLKEKFNNADLFEIGTFVFLIVGAICLFIASAMFCIEVIIEECKG